MHVYHGANCSGDLVQMNSYGVKVFEKNAYLTREDEEQLR